MRIAIIFCSGIGDFLMFTPVVNILNKEFPTAKYFAFLWDKTVGDIFKRIVNNVEIVIEPNWNLFNFNLLKKILYIRKQKIDLAIIGWPHMGIKSAFISWAINAKLRIGFNYKLRKFPFLKNLFLSSSVEYYLNEHYIKRNLSLIEKLKIKNDEIKLLFPISQVEEKWAKEFLNSEKIQNKKKIAFHIGCNSNQRFKRWPLNYFANLADLFIKEYNAVVIALLGPAERDLEQIFMQNVKNKENVILLKNISIFHVGAILRNVDFLVSNDSGISHISAAVGTPVFSIFGPANENHTHPWGYYDFVIKNENINCRPCYNFPGQKVSCQNRICLTQLYPETVYSSIINKLKLKNLFG